MRKLNLFLALSASFCMLLQADDLVTKSKKTTYKNYKGLAGPDPNGEGIVILYGDKYTKAVVPVNEFPNDFKDIERVKKMAVQLPALKADAKARQNAEKVRSAKQTAEAKRGNARLRQVLAQQAMEEQRKAAAAKKTTKKSSSGKLKSL